MPGKLGWIAEGGGRKRCHKGHMISHATEFINMNILNNLEVMFRFLIRARMKKTARLDNKHVSVVLVKKMGKRALWQMENNTRWATKTVVSEVKKNNNTNNEEGIKKSIKQIYQIVFNAKIRYGFLKIKFYYIWKRNS